MNKKYSIFCILLLSIQYAWGMESQNPRPVTVENLRAESLQTDVVFQQQNHNYYPNSHNEKRANMDWQQKTADSLEQGSWHAVEQFPYLIMNFMVTVGGQKLLNYFESGSAKDAAFAHDINNVEKEEVFRALLKNQLTQVATDEEELTKQIASCSNKTERATLQKLLEQKREYRTKIIQQYHLFSHQHAENVMEFVEKHSS